MPHDGTEVAALLPWVEPIIETLDIAETEAINHRGNDGGRFIDTTKS